MGVREIIAAFKRVQSAQKKLYDYDVADLRAQLAAAEADKLAFGERVREAVLAELIANMVWMPKSRRAQAKAAILALDLDALAEGEK
jgi:hypothetical protein